MKLIPNKLTLLFITALTVFSFSGCGSSGVSSDDNLVGGDHTTAPEVATSYAITAHHGSTVVVHSHVSEPTSGTHSHQWTQISGPSVALSTTNAPTTTYVAPANTTQPVVLQHTVTHSQTGQTTNTSHTITHTPATINLAVKVSNPITIESGQKASLHASATGGDGHYTYTWIQSSGSPVSLDVTHPSAPTFIAPVVNSLETLVFEVTVTDGTGSAISASETVTVKPKKQVPPPTQALTVVANVPTDVNEGTNFHVSAHVNGGTGPYTYKWESVGTHVGKFIDPSLQTAIFETDYLLGQPIVVAQIKVTVTDAKGVSATSFEHYVAIHDVPLTVTVAATGGTITQGTPPISFIATVKAGQPLVLTALGHGGNAVQGQKVKYTYEWYDAATQLSPISTDENLAFTGAITQAIFDAGNHAPPYRIKVTNTVGTVIETAEEIVSLNVVAP